MRSIFFVCMGLMVLVVCGCAPEYEQPLWGCPGTKSVSEAVSRLGSHSNISGPLSANGQCLLEYYVEGKKHRENFPVKLWINPPSEIYLQGDIAFDPKGLIVGSNEEEFWISVKPGKISGYWWGRWSETDGAGGLMISPEMVLEAFGIIDVGGGEQWSLSKEGIFDVIVKREGGLERQKIYISSCDYVIKKIEYFDSKGGAATVVKLRNHRQAGENFLVPGDIDVESFDSSGKKRKLDIAFGSIRPVEITEWQRSRLFTRPEPKGFKNVYKIIGGVVEQQ